jgi:RNA polymerase sigma factor (sigma-70 family)
MAKSELNPDESAPEALEHVAGATTLWNNSWRDFYDHFQGVIFARARGERLNEHSSQDVVQEVMTTLVQAQNGQAAGHDPKKGTFTAWIQVVTYHRIQQVRRKDFKERTFSPLPEDESGTDNSGGKNPLADLSEMPPDFAAREEKQWQKAMTSDAMKKVCDRVNPEKFAIFIALLEEREAPQELARKYSKTVNNIYQIKNSCGAMLAEETQKIHHVWKQLDQLNR